MNAAYAHRVRETWGYFMTGFARSAIACINVMCPQIRTFGYWQCSSNGVLDWQD